MAAIRQPPAGPMDACGSRRAADWRSSIRAWSGWTPRRRGRSSKRCASTASPCPARLPALTRSPRRRHCVRRPGWAAYWNSVFAPSGRARTSFRPADGWAHAALRAPLSAYERPCSKRLTAWAWIRRRSSAAKLCPHLGFTRIVLPVDRVNPCTGNDQEERRSRRATSTSNTGLASTVVSPAARTASRLSTWPVRGLTHSAV